MCFPISNTSRHIPSVSIRGMCAQRPVYRRRILVTRARISFLKTLRSRRRRQVRRAFQLSCHERDISKWISIANCKRTRTSVPASRSRRAG